VISRVRAGLVGAFFEGTSEGVEKLGRAGSGLEVRGCKWTGVDGCCFGVAADWAPPVTD
jgi:hypothetical protein